MLHSQKHQLILIDDDEDFCELLQGAFAEKHPNCQMEIFHRGQAFLSWLDETSSGLPDLILLDLLMPEIDGFSILQYLKKHHYLKAIPTIILSASIDPSKIRECYEVGANSYFTKPIKPEDFDQLIDLISRYWLEISQLPSKIRRF